MNSEARPARSSEMVLGTSSPRTTCKTVRNAKASDNGHAVGHERGAAAGQPIQHGAKDLGEHGLAEGANGQAGERDADLHAGDDAVELAESSSCTMRARRVAVLDQLAHARGAHGDQRKLRGGEEAVDADQHQHGQQAQANHVLRFYQPGAIRQSAGRVFVSGGAIQVAAPNVGACPHCRMPRVRAGAMA